MKSSPQNSIATMVHSAKAPNQHWLKIKHTLFIVLILIQEIRCFAKNLLRVIRVQIIFKKY